MNELHNMRRRCEQIIDTTASAWGLRPALPELLRPPGGSSQTEQAAARGAAGRDRPYAGRTKEAVGFKGFGRQAKAKGEMK